jgi:hypothetical protein
MPTYQITAISTEHRKTTLLILFINVLQKLYHGPKFATEFKEENFMKEYHAMLSMMQNIVEEL